MTYVDERIVELKFDNKQFEQETSKTMSTLDKLKEKLQFKNASSGAEHLQKAVANINFNPVISGINTIETKMSALSVAGKRVVENIVDWGMSGLNKLISKLNVVNQIITGGKTRALNIEQAKFQLEGLGVAWEDIQEDINYGVQDTAYGLDAAAKVASQLVASQVQLGDDMKHALLGISGVAAMTNSTYEDIGHIYTTVAGNGRLMGEQLLQLSGRGINAAATLAKALHTTEAEVRDMVSKGKISFQMFSDAMWESFGEHAKSANKTFQGALSNTKAALSRLGADVAAQGFNSIRDILNEIIPKLKEFKKQMKPVEDAIISMVDSIGKLIQTMIKAIDIEGIVKRISPVLETAAKTIGEFADAYSMVFSERRTTRLGSKNATAFIEEQKGLNNLKATAEAAKEEMVDLTQVSDKEKEMAEDIWKYGTYGNGAERMEALGEHYKNVQAYLEEMINLGWDESKMEAKLTEETKKNEAEQEKAARAEKRKSAIENLMAILGNLKHVAQNVFHSIGNILSVAFEAFGQTFNSTSFVGGLINFTARLAEISDKLFINRERAEKLRPVFEMVGKVILFIGRSILTMAKWVSIGITKIGELYEKAKESEKLKKIKDNMVRIFTTIYDTIIDIYENLKSRGIIKALLNGLGTVLEFVTGVLADGLEHFSGIFTFTIDALGKGVTGLTDALSFLFTSVLNGIRGPLNSFVEIIKDIINALSFGNIIKAGGILYLVKIIYTIFKFFSNILRFASGITEVGVSIASFFKSLSDITKAKARQINVETIVTFMNGVTKLIWAIVALTLVMSLIPNAKAIAWQAFAIVAIMTALYGAIAIISQKMTDNKNQKNVSFLNLTIKTEMAQIGILFAGMGVMLMAIMKALNSLYSITTAKDFSARKFIISLAGVITMLSAMMIIFTRIVALINDNKVKGIGKIGVFFVLIALSIKILTNALTTVYDTIKTGGNINHFVIISGVIVALFGMAFLMMEQLSKAKKMKNIGRVAAMFLSFAISIKIVGKAITELMKAIHEIGDPDAIRQATTSIVAITGVIGLLLIVLVYMAKNTSSKIKDNSVLGQASSNSRTGGFGPLLGVSMILTSFAFVLRSIAPALNAVSKAYKEMGSDKALDAIWSLIAIVGVIGLLVVAIQGIGAMYGSPSLTEMLGISAVILSLSLAIKGFGKTIQGLSGIDTKKIVAIATTLGVFMAVLVGLTVVIGKLLGADGALALLAFAAVIASVGLSMYLSAAGFKYFGETIMAFIKSLPEMIDALLYFFNTVKQNKETLKTGLIETISVMAEGAIMGVAEAAKYLIVAVPMMVSYFTSALIAAINQLANDIVQKGPDFVDALNNLTYAIAWLYVYASENAFDLIKDSLKKKFADLITYVLPYIGRPEKGWGDAFGTTTTTTTVDSSTLAAMAKNDSETAVNSYIAQIEEEKAKAAKNNKGAADWIGKLDTYLDMSDINVSNNKTINKLSKNLGFDISKIDYSYVKDSVLNNDFSNITELSGITYGEGFTGAIAEGIENGDTNVIDSLNGMYTDMDEINLDYADDMTEYGELGFTNYKEGVEKKKEAVVNASKEVQDAAIAKIVSYEPEYYKAGVFLTQGLADGIAEGNGKKMVISNVADMVRDLKHKAMEDLKISSPSRVFEEIGNFVTLGLAKGIIDLSSAASEATAQVGEDATSSLRSILDRIFDTTMSGLDTNPTITPILDLDNLEQGLNDAAAMMSGRKASFGLAFGASSAYNNNLAAKFAPVDNTVTTDNTEVVDAITGLRQDVEDLKGALSGLGFYVDGREMAKAIANPMNDELNDISIRTGRGVR